jgi:HlyD family secretion protein
MRTWVPSVHVNSTHGNDTSEDAADVAEAMAPQRGKRRRWRAFGWGFAALVVLSLGALPFFWDSLRFKLRTLQLKQGTLEATDFNYTTYRVDRGQVEQIISATGRLRVARATSVGAEVSGQIADVFVSFNAPVTKGQLLARIDPRPFELRVRQTQARLSAVRADLTRAEAQMALAQTDVEVRSAEMARQNQLGQSGFASTRAVENTRLELERARANSRIALAAQESARADIARAQADLAQAQFDLARTRIIAPSNGVVVRRLVEPGQTVAATLQTPLLFELADSLSTLQLEAQVDEADIADITPGQAVRFSVDAYPGQIFNGEVVLVRNDAQDRNGVISYPVSIRVENKDQRLKPGMSATLSIIVRQANDALRVPVAALEFVPPASDKPEKITFTNVQGGSKEEILAQVYAKAEGIRMARKAERAALKARLGFTLWRLDDVQSATLVEVPVKIGARSEDFVEIASGDVKVTDPIILSAQRK